MIGWMGRVFKQVGMIGRIGKAPSSIRAMFCPAVASKFFDSVSISCSHCNCVIVIVDCEIGLLQLCK